MSPTIELKVKISSQDMISFLVQLSELVHTQINKKFAEFFTVMILKETRYPGMQSSALKIAHLMN